MMRHDSCLPLPVVLLLELKNGEHLVTRRPTYNELKKRVHILEDEIAKQAYSEQVLREACDRFGSLTDGLLGPLMIINGDLIIEEVNERFLERYGVQRQEVIGRQCYEVTHGFDEPCTEGNYACPGRAAIETGKPHRTEHYSQCKGAHTVEEVFAFPLMDKNGQVRHVVEMCHDVAPDRRENQEQNEQERLEGVIEMAGAVCLELSQPLQALSFHCERLQKAISEENLLYEQIDQIIVKIDKMSEILGKLQHIATYVTKEHVEGTKIVDIDRASRSDSQ
jgi:PAS domain S-box-containing protein